MWNTSRPNPKRNGIVPSLLTLLLALFAGLSGCVKDDPASTTPGGKPGASTNADSKSGETPVVGKAPATGADSVVKETPVAAGSAAEQDTLVLAYGNDPDSVNPVLANDTVSEDFMRWVYESMAERKFSNPDAWEPVLAEKWEFDKEKLEYKIHLRKGVSWHPLTLPSGKKLPSRPFTARDVKFTFDCILNPNTQAATLRSFYEDPDATDDAQKYKLKVTVIDDYTVKMKWTKPYMLLTEFSLNIPIIPRHIFSVDEKGEPITQDFASKEFADAFNDHWANRRMCGTGPMIMSEWRKDERVTLIRNPDYWGNRFYFSKAIFRAIPNAETSKNELMEGQTDWGGIPEKEKFKQCESHANVKSGLVKLTTYDFPAYRYIGYNTKHPFLKDKAVRWALGHAVPVDEIIDKVWLKYASRITGPFLPGGTGTDTSLKALEYDLEKSRTLLTDAGWVDSDGDGIREKMVDGKKVLASYELMIFADAPSFQTIAEIVKENCRKVGVNVTLTPNKWSQMLQRLRKKEFDASMLGWAMSWKQDPYQIWHSSQANALESSNSIAYANEEVDQLIEQLRVTLDEAEQGPIFKKIHKLIYDDQPYTFLFMEKRTGAYHSRLQDINYYKIRPCIDPREWTARAPRMMSEVVGAATGVGKPKEAAKPEPAKSETKPDTKPEAKPDAKPVDAKSGDAEKPKGDEVKKDDAKKTEEAEKTK